MAGKEGCRKIVNFTPEAYKNLQRLKLECETNQDAIVNRLIEQAGKKLLERLYHGGQVRLSDIRVYIDHKDSESNEANKNDSGGGRLFGSSHHEEGKGNS